jgi:PKD repeat protein
MKRKFYLFLSLLSTFAIFGTGSVNAQSYSCQGHYYGCSYNNNNSRRYAAINKLQILTSGTNVYEKTPDDCNVSPQSNTGGHYNVMSTQPSFTMVSGNTYEVKFNITNPGGYNGYQNYFMVYIDLNGDGDYSDAGEHTSAGWNTFSSSTTHTKTFTIPCAGVKSGVSRIRFRTDYQYGPFRNRVGDHSTRGTYGETEEFTINLSSPSSILPTFSMPDSIYKGTFAKAVYTGNGGKIWWDWDTTGAVAGGTVFTGINTSTLGCIDLKCISENCFGKDSSTKTICIVDPTSAVIADFVADETSVQLYEDIQFYDLSDFGPTDWNWEIYDTMQSPHIVYDLTFKSGGTDQNPVFDFYEPGLFTVCLTGYNIFGWGNTLCKKDYIEVTPFKEWDVSASWGTPIESTSGRLYDKGGIFLDYESNASKFTNFLAVIPCNADKIDLTFKQFNMADDNDFRILR